VKAFLKKHWLALLIAIAIGCVIFWPRTYTSNKPS